MRLPQFCDEMLDVLLDRDELRVRGDESGGGGSILEMIDLTSRTTLAYDSTACR